MALKIVKHCQEEGAGGTDLVQGVLLGLVVDNRLEITNCFPFPRHNEEEDFDEGTVKPVYNSQQTEYRNMAKYKEKLDKAKHGIPSQGAKVDLEI